MIQIQPTTPVYFLSENLLSLLNRPGRELTVKVLQVEGKTLHLELGGEKFQAQVSGIFNPEDFEVGENLRVRVERTEPEIVLRLVSPQKKSIDLVILHSVKRENMFLSEQERVEKRLELTTLTGFLKRLVATKGKKFQEREEGEDWVPQVKLKKPLYYEDKFLLPLVFPENTGWGYFEFFPPHEEVDKLKLFKVVLFFPYLSLVEINFYLKNQNLEIMLDFSSKEGLKMAREYLSELKNLLASEEKSFKVYLRQKEITPGYLLFDRG